MRAELITLRKAKGLSQKQMAKLLGCSRSYYTLIELSQRNGTQDFWDNLQHEFKISDALMWQIMRG